MNTAVDRSHRITVRVFAGFLAALMLMLAAAVCAPSFYAAGSIDVASSEEFYNALCNSGVDTINIISGTAPIVELAVPYQLDRALSINGRGAVLSIFEDGQIRVKNGASLTLTNMTMSSSEDYGVVAEGNLVFGESVVIAGSFGVLLNAGAGVTSGQNTVSVSESVVRAMGVNAGGGSVSVSNFRIEQAVGEAEMMYVSPNAGTLRFSDDVSIIAAAGSAVMCPSGKACPDIAVSQNSALNVSARNNPEGGAAIDIRKGGITFGKDSQTTVFGCTGGIIASGATLSENSVVKIACSSQGSSASSGSANAGVWLDGRLSICAGAVLDMLENPIPCNGIYAGGGVGAADGSTIRICGNGGQHSGICTPKDVTLGNSVSLTVRSVGNGIICDAGMTTGDKVTLSLTDIADYGIYSIGTLQAEKLFFGSDNTMEISAGKCAIYTRESVDISNGSQVSLTASNRAPALWIDAETSAQGHLSVKGSQVDVKCSASSQAVHNSGIYVVGAVTVDELSRMTVLNNGDFGTIVTYGDINVSTDSAFYSSGGCGIYLLSGNLRLTQGGKLYTEGTVDSGVRIEHGVLNAGEHTALDTQGARFGVEVLGDGGVWLNDMESFDIRSTADRAVYIQNGSLNISGVPRLSAWVKDGRNNPSHWWRKDVSGMHSWEIIGSLDGADKLYADYTMLSPSGLQQYTDGTAGISSGFVWYNSVWDADNYSRLGQYTSRPIARSNSFFIPEGKSFSWRLHGESYSDGALTYKVSTTENDAFVLGEGGRFTYNAPTYVSGMQNYTYYVVDSDGVQSDEATISINVTASKPPIVCSDTFITEQGKELIDDLEMYDYDGNISTTEVDTLPSNGTLLLSSDGRFSYTPKTGFSGVDSFTYYAIDDLGDKSNIGYVSIVVGAPSAAVPMNDTLITEAETPVSTALAVINSDDFKDDEQQAEPIEGEDGAAAEPQDTAYHYEITAQPIYGILSFVDTDIVEYVPYEDFSGTDSLSYRVVFADGSFSEEAVLTFAIIPNQRPQAESASYSCVSGSKRTGNLVADDIDGNIVSYEIVEDVDTGKLTLDKHSGKFTYEAPMGFTGKTSFVYKVTDSDGISSHEAVITINVIGLIDYLRQTDRLKTAFVAGACIVISLIVIIVLVISHLISRRKEKKLEEEREKMLDSLYPDDDDDGFGPYDNLNGGGY